MAKGVFGLPGLRISGKLNGTAIVPLADGRVVIRELPDRLPPRTPNQKVTAGRFQGVAAAWRGLSLAEVEAWRRYATGLRNPHPALPQGGGIQPYQAFTALAAKCLQMRPGEPVPTLPPTTGFLGDGISVVVQASLPAKADLSEARSGKKRTIADFETEGAGGDRNGAFAGTEACATREPLPQPSLQGKPLEEGAIVFSASGPNSEGVVTEVLLQKLKTRNRMPNAKDYRTQRFVAFAAGSLSATVECPAGAYACAIRFVRESTGQETALVPLGLVEVE